MTKTKTEDVKDIKMVEGLLSFSNKICELSSKVENIQGKKPEIIVLLIYAVAHMVISFFHEPWYDEAVAWQIARSASLSDILFQIPHYEGHPPLWHLILLPLAKLGAPYELSLSLVSLIFAGLAVGLIVFRSPFPRIIRLLIPFTYFFFYQYGVISRPYCVMMLVFVLLAMTYDKRNEQPWKYVVCLMLLCLTSAYGIVISGGLAIVWLWEIWGRRNIKDFIVSAFKDKRIWCLAGLFALAMVLIWMILPAQDTHAMNLEKSNNNTNSFFTVFLYTMLVLPADVCITSVCNDYSTTFQHADLSVESMLSGLLIGLILWGFAISLGKRKGTLGLFCVPYIMFAFFGAKVYMSLHHIGIALLFIIFWLWVSLEKKAETTMSTKLSETGGALLRIVSLTMCCLAVVVSLSWNIISCVQDINSVYALGRNEAKFIAENGLDKYNIMVGWSVFRDEDGNIIGSDTNYSIGADNIAPYFPHNIFFNFNDGKDELNYTTHKVATKKENKQNISEWKKIKPDVLCGTPKLELVYDENELSIADYKLVYCGTSAKTWKGLLSFGRFDIYVRNDLAKELGLEEVEEKFWYE